MNKRARRESEKENLRNFILEAAIKIIADEGYDKLTMRRIAKVIGYTPTTLYLYYKDKEQILEDIVREVYRKIIVNVAEVVRENKHTPIDKQLELAFKSFIDTMVSNAEMSRAVIRSGSKAMFREVSIGEPFEENEIPSLYEMLLEGQRQLIFRKLDDNVSRMLVASILGFAMNAVDNQLHLNSDWDKQTDVYVEILINGLRMVCK